MAPSKRFGRGVLDIGTRERFAREGFAIAKALFFGKVARQSSRSRQEGQIKE